MGRGLTRSDALPVERISANDLSNLATDHGRVPMNIAAALVVDDGALMALDDLRALLDDRVPRVPRMRQRLVRPGIGAGRPVWVDDPEFEVSRHVEVLPLDAMSGPDDAERALLQTTADLCCQRLPRDRPLWMARWVTGLPEDRAALVLVIHHVLADGIGGLAVLAALADDGEEPDLRPFPQPTPGWRSLVADAWRERGSALRGIRTGLSRSRRGLREAGVTKGRIARAPRTSLNRPTGSRRRLTTVTTPLEPVADLGHAKGCTVNDVVLTAIVGAFAGTLHARGESPHTLVVSVPVSSRRSATTAQLGNETGVAPLRLPTTADPAARLEQIAAATGRLRGSARGSSAAPLGLLFRALGRARLVQPLIDRQRLVNTFVTNVRGPAQPLSLGGHRVSAVIPVGLNPGNVGVTFAVLSYAGQLGITVIADPVVVPDQDRLTELLTEQLAELLQQPSAG